MLRQLSVSINRSGPSIKTGARAYENLSFTVRTVQTIGKVATSERWIVVDTAADYRRTLYSLRGEGDGREME